VMSRNGKCREAHPAQPEQLAAGLRALLSARR
jgi:hypothetical protein